MKHLLVVALVGALAFTASAAWGADAVPWQGAGAAPGAVQGAAPGAKPVDPAVAPAPAAAPAVAGDLKSELTPAQYKSLVKPIEDAVASAEKELELVKKEADKPQEKPGTVAGMKVKAADFYLNAANKAKTAATRLPKDKDAAKTTLADQYEKPNKQKAIDLLLEVAKEAMDRKDYSTAVALYKRVLVVEPDNAIAKDALTELEKLAKAAQANGKNGQGAAGGNNKPDPSLINQPWQNVNGKPANGWSHAGAPTGPSNGFGSGW